MTEVFLKKQADSNTEENNLLTNGGGTFLLLNPCNMQAIVYKTDGTKETVQLPKNNRLEKLQEIVGGYIESVRVSDPKYIMYVNEDGLYLKLETNPFYPTLVGNVVLLEQ